LLDRNYRDVATGLALALIGGGSAVYALTHYALGTVKRMGPGMMPTSLGVILAVFGLIIAVPAFFESRKEIDVRFRALVILSASVLSFMLLIETFGLILAVFSTTMIATFAENKVPLRRGLILAASMSLLTWTIFILGLRLPISAFDWPF